MRATLDGFPIPADQASEWSLTEGVAPFVLVLDLEASTAQAIFDQARPGESVLVLDPSSAGGEPIPFERLTVLGTGPTSSPYRSSLTLVDSRYSLQFGPLICRRYNVPRRSGSVRRVASEGAPIAAGDLIADLVYHVWSLKEGRPWTAEEVLRDVMDRAFPGGWDDEDNVLGGGAGKLPEVQALEIVANPAPALATVLAYLGGRIGITLRKGGRPALIDRLSGRERELVGLGAARGTRTRGSGAFPRVVGPGLWAEQDRRKERPARVVVHFAPACELRADHVERTTSGGTVATAAIPCDQVLPAPEDLQAADERQILESTWTKLDDFLAWLAGKQPLAGLPPLSRDLLRKGWLHGLPEEYAAVDGSGVWAARVAALRAHYRGTYRLSQTWLDRVSAIRAYRVAILDTETAAQGASLAYQDWSEWRTWRGIQSKSAADLPEHHELVKNRWANEAAKGGGIVGTPLADLQAAPGRVEIVDEDVGVFRVSLRTDSTGQASRIERSALDPQRTPTAAPGARNRYLQDGWLSEEHELSTVLTVQPAAPNDERQLYSIALGVSDVAELLPQGGQNRIAEGPEHHVFVEPSRELARFAWDDTRSAEIVQAFTEGSSVSIGDAYGDPANLDVLTGLAVAIAAQIYTGFEDHLEGALTTGLRGDLGVLGTASRVSHSIGPAGALTTITLPSEPPKVSDRPYLSPAVRRVVERFVSL